MYVLLLLSTHPFPCLQVYGSPHLLRLLVKLPELLTNAPISRQEADALNAHLADFVK